MWPGDQQHGGEQNPKQPNPYQQPGGEQNPQQPNPQQPNPYQQPGYQQPNPYQQQQPPPGYGYPQQPPGQEQNPYQQQPGQQWGHPTVPGGPQVPQGGGNKSRTTVIAIVAAVAVIAAAVITGVFVLAEDDGKKNTAGDPTPSASASNDEKPSASPSQSTAEDDGSAPVIDGWQAVINPKHYSAFDVPKNDDWTIASQGTITGFGDDETGDILVGMSAPAYFKDDWCKDSSRAIVGTKGGQGSKGTKEAAEIAASNWVIAGYDQKQKGTLKESGPKAFSNDNGIKGHIASATITGAPKTSKCSADGKVVSVAWINNNDDLAIWVLVTDANVDDEVPKATIKKMTDSLRNFGEPGSGDDPRG